jgi:hypothetical protein
VATMLCPGHRMTPEPRKNPNLNESRRSPTILANYPPVAKSPWRCDLTMLDNVRTPMSIRSFHPQVAGSRPARVTCRTTTYAGDRANKRQGPRWVPAAKSSASKNPVRAFFAAWIVIDGPVCNRRTG